ncbi:MAG: hypothetical protein A3I44_03970 [Candidatus Sungbacteria bacterium RIFCSPLOWO2_02_FULL_51_17]|uniref:HTH luxR-type domain-containing protein n=1 Tax=Candidatus Sungbacteria bacterium RIFCSPHIGHO2_02_FULL_51_29 TaxID=1802273 RepID=A0A1G2KS67_9BACT|nr:MAG: hypothetical protein A2676_02490 [Candidatus Sungbacteria bacterium RIFCSPHIGHO2_01_FULL_51_22]OHA02240.1 MAG: hypothetical protein A3C16_04040 [Candidatus Sungbacteria bacterium RIFCSPHIGHO2_02_FULL_51_29]OHA06066.1 MAG: hypothetical protein A3B29_05345 [Candidatus Sungbacteria bacterium RIFCSPLOWO2_01_FULL_51_34]OHA11243.1 MAG: hypothetical protein A3I44_03970 [Candidatus Sungbacteria bacterium RIFCSPLOWO2_02_FULL_51_17]
MNSEEPPKTAETPEDFMLEDKDAENAHDELVLEGSQRDPRLFELLVRKYQQPFFRTAMRIVHNREDAEDISQEAFVKIYSKAHLFKKREGASFKSWGYAILVNTAISHLRSAKRSRSKDVGWDPVLDQVLPDPKQFEDFERKEMQEILSGVLNELPPQLKSILEMRYFEDQSYRAIAAKTTLSLENVKIRLHRAKKAAKEIFDAI